MKQVDQFFAVLAAYRKATGLSEGRVSTMLFSGGMRIAKIRSGGDVGSRRCDAAMVWFEENWPHGAVWPEGVKRPSQHLPNETHSEDEVVA